MFTGTCLLPIAGARMQIVKPCIFGSLFSPCHQWGMLRSSAVFEAAEPQKAAASRASLCLLLQALASHLHAQLQSPCRLQHPAGSLQHKSLLAFPTKNLTQQACVLDACTGHDRRVVSGADLDYAEQYQLQRLRAPPCHLGHSVVGLWNIACLHHPTPCRERL